MLFNHCVAHLKQMSHCVSTLLLKMLGLFVNFHSPYHQVFITIVFLGYGGQHFPKVAATIYPVSRVLLQYDIATFPLGGYYFSITPLNLGKPHDCSANRI